MDRKKVMFVVGCLVLVAASAIFGGVLGFKKIDINKKEREAARDKSFAEINKNVDKQKVSYNKDVKNILLIGTDKKADDKQEGRSNTMIIFTIDNVNRQLKLTSLMKDTYVEIPDYGKNRLCSAYAIGGPDLLYQTILKNYNIMLDGYITVNEDSFKSVIDKIGGVDVELKNWDANFIKKKYKEGTPVNVVAGINKFDGAQAVAYCKISEDAKGNYGQAERQRLFLNALYSELKSKSVEELIPLATELSKMVKTDLSLMQIKTLIADAIKTVSDSLYFSQFPRDDMYEPKYVDNRNVLVPTEEAVAEMNAFIFGMCQEEETTESISGTIIGGNNTSAAESAQATTQATMQESAKQTESQNTAQENSEAAKDNSQNSAGSDGLEKDSPVETE